MLKITTERNKTLIQILQLQILIHYLFNSIYL